MSRAVLLGVVVAAVLLPATAPPAVAGAGEQRLREFEEDVLGPEHAAAHAGGRRLRKAGAVASDGAAARATLAAEPADPALFGRWGAPFPIPVMGIHATVLATGKVMWWSYPPSSTLVYGDPSYPNTAQAWLWDPANGALRRVDPPLVRDPDNGQMKPANIWCSGQMLLADGRLLVTGGSLRYPGADDPPNPSFGGLKKVFTFNPFNETWTEQPDMANGRWYPSQVLLPDGRAAIMSGFDESGTGFPGTNKDIDIFTPSPDMDGRGTITTLGTRGPAGSPPDGNLYPHLFAMPSGRVMVAGPDPNDSWFLNDPGPGNVFGYSEFAPASRQRMGGAGVLRPGGVDGSTQVTLIGGSDRRAGYDPAGVPTTETFDESDTAAGWQPGAPLTIGRSHANVVLLPDSSMVAVGGGVGLPPPEDQWAADAEQRQVELYDPVADSWRLGAAQAESRAYHSTAVLLPDGRVLSAGDDINGGFEGDTAEIYEPPYLFKGLRPVIADAPDTARYGMPIPVATPDAVASASLVAPSATTHTNDMSQRVVKLSVEQVSGGVSLTAPASARIAPPGWYMLFVLDGQDVPSVARWILLGENPPQPGRVEIEKRTQPAGSRARFHFTGGPFGAVELGDAQEVFARVPAGRYPVTEAPAPGFELRSVSCDDGSPASVATRRATPDVSPDETVRCVFTSAALPPAPSSRAPAIPPDKRGPRLALRATAAALRRGLIRGTASDSSGVIRVEVALGRGVGRLCRWWSRGARSFSRRRRSCRRPKWIRARLIRRTGGASWSVKLGARPPAGRYAVALRGIDGKRNLSTRLGRAAPRIRIRR